LISEQGQPWLRHAKLEALIVWIFSGRSTNELAREVEGLRYEVSELKRSIDAQTSELKVLQQILDKKSGAGDAAKDG
jgi:chaperonin cofactor prefoldin